MEWKEFFINIVFAIIGLSLTMGLVGLSVYMSHWYSLINYDTFIETLGPTWKNIGISASTFLTLSVVAAVLSFSFDFTTYLLAFSGICQLPAIVLVGIVVNFTTRKDEMYNKFIENYNNIKDLKKQENEWECSGLAGVNDCLNFTIEGDARSLCCNAKIESLIENRTTKCHDWILGFMLLWVISLVLLIVLSIIFCIRPKKEE